jgi:hypothetical protein
VCEKLKQDFYAKLFENIRFQQEQQSRPIPGVKRIGGASTVGTTNEMQKYEVYQPGKRVKLAATGT